MPSCAFCLQVFRRWLACSSSWDGALLLWKPCVQGIPFVRALQQQQNAPEYFQMQNLSRKLYAHSGMMAQDKGSCTEAQSTELCNFTLNTWEMQNSC